MQEKSALNGIKFISFSLFGIFMFFVSITIGGKSTIPLDHIVSWIQRIPHYAKVYGLTLVTIGGLLPFIKREWNRDLTTAIFSICKLFGIICVVMVVFNIGPEGLLAGNMLPFIFSKIVVSVTTIIPVGSVFLAFITGYGLMEFIGVFMRPIMKPIWKTPGRSAIDAVASFVGSYSIALLITNRVYTEGKYTDKEAAIIATGFSTVSATFMIIVANTLGIMDYWLKYFWITVIVTFLVTAITARIYPLSRKKDTYYGNMDGDKEKDVVGNRAMVAWEAAMDTCSKAPRLVENVAINFKDGFALAINVAPTLMGVGALGLILANYTPIFDIMGYIFYPVTLIMRIPEPLLTAKAVSVSIAEMLLPAIVVTESSLATRFIVAIVSVSEILFFSASIPCMMATEIPLTMLDYIIIWIERVILSLIIAAPLVYLLIV